MKISQHHFTGGAWRDALGTPSGPSRAQLVLAFGATSEMQSLAWRAAARAAFPEALLIGGSSAGEICGESVWDDSVVLTAVEFEHSRVSGACVALDDDTSSRGGGAELARRLIADDLRHVFVLCDGIHVNGSEVVDGLASVLPADVTVTGGLAGDGPRFERTIVMHDGESVERAIVGVGLYGDQLRIGCGSMGGWDPFGPYRTVTRSNGNVLHELDGESALSIYKRYLGEHAKDLPASGLLFPLTLRRSSEDEPLVRTILAVDEEAQTLTFAGDIPEGVEARFMKANFNRLVDGAGQAARASQASLTEAPELGILISCVGRKMVLGPRIEEEVEAVRDVLGPGATLTGFYSYGEISPFSHEARCSLHNQTMTVTTISES